MENDAGAIITTTLTSVIHILWKDQI